MARFIDLDKVEFLKVEGNKEFNHGVDCCINSLLEIEPADVIECSEYEKLRLVNLDLTETTKGLLAEHEQLLKLRSKINKAIEEIDFLRQHRAKCITKDNKICIDSGEVLRILRNIE